ncbi:MAG: hypothetical protein J6S58_10885, partial [Lentisphaeria bacterium]|nr:hypothetical protein [Lentisphaeria bacterium]
MLKSVFSVLLLSWTILLCGAELPLTAHWDFTKGSFHSVDSRYKMRPRGDTEIVEENNGRFLKPGMTSGSGSSGLESLSVKGELSPAGAFRLEMRVAFTQATSNRNNLFLYDTKNVPYPSKVPANNMGILFMAVRDLKRNLFRLVLSCGNGERSFLVTSPQYKLELEKPCDLHVEYEETGFVTFKFNGKAHRVKTAFGGSLIPGFRRPVIGDRCGSTYSPFEGKIYSVKLFSKPLPVSPKTSPGKKVSVKKAARSAPRKKPSLSVNAGFS